MSVRPVDMQVLLPRSLDISKSDNALSHRPDAQQQEFSQLFQKKTEEASKQVIETNKAEKNGIDKDGKNNDRESRQKKKKRNSAANEKQNKGTSSMYDVSV